MRAEVARRLRTGDSGYAMVALLVALSVMAIVLTMALPVWTTAARREKEAELVFRGEQYARAIGLFQRKYGNAVPPSVEALIEEKFLRKQYKDPITGDDFQLLTPGMPIPGQEGPVPATTGRGTAATQERMRAAQELLRAEKERLARTAEAARPGAATAGRGLIGVVSKSTERSLRLYNGRDKYNEWVFLATQQSTAAGGGARGGAVPGGRGGASPGAPGGRGGRGGRLTLPGPGGRGGSPFGPVPGGARGAAPPER